MRRERKPGTPPGWQFALAGLGYAVLCALAFEPIGLWPIALLTPTPLVWAACRCAGRKVMGPLLVGIGTLPFWVFAHLYLLNITAAGYPAMCVYLAAWPMLFVVLLGWALRAAPAVPATLLTAVVGTTLEMLRGELVLTGYAWYVPGQPLIDVPTLAYPASLFGMYFVSMLVYALCGAVADASGWSERPRKLGGMGAGVVLVVWFISSTTARTIAEEPTGSIRVAAVQTNIRQDNKISWPVQDRISDFGHFLSLTQTAALATPKPQLILWPETMFPGQVLDSESVRAVRTVYLKSKEGEQPFMLLDGTFTRELYLSYFAEELLRVQAELGIPMVVGAIGQNGTEFTGGRVESESRYNSAFLIDAGRVSDQRYDKMDLTPFGEVIPYLWRYPELQQQVLALGAAGMSFDLGFGERPRTIDIPIRRGPGEPPRVLAAVPICFEVTKPLTCRRLAMEAPEGKAAFIINLSNDGWFADFPGRDMHLQCARWRSIELNLAMVRSVNTGLSAFIDRAGRVRKLGPDKAERPDRVDGVLFADVPMLEGGSNTLFARTGHIPIVGALSTGALVALVMQLTRSRKARAARV